VNTKELAAKCQRRPGEPLLRVIEWEGQNHDEYTNHSKFALFDQEEAIVGSFNLDPRSASLNSETVLAFRNRQIVTELYNQVFDYDIPLKSRVVTPAEAESYARPLNSLQRIELWGKMLLSREL